MYDTVSTHVNILLTNNSPKVSLEDSTSPCSINSTTPLQRFTIFRKVEIQDAVLQIDINSIKGQVKVIIAPHDAHALRGTNDVPCDAYCQKIDGAFLDFYSNEESKD